MKYPQLVSSRAVSAISDWLATRLEQLGVEAPLIYSRLLLSLLNTPVHANDQNEIKTIDQSCLYWNAKKPGLSAENSIFLQKSAAIKCLMDALTTENEIETVETLINELHEKLKALTNNEVETLQYANSSAEPCFDEDPRKLYYRAFPALSKALEDCVNNKLASRSAEWPQGGNYNYAIKRCAGSKKNKRKWHQASLKGRNCAIRKSSNQNVASSLWDSGFEDSWKIICDQTKDFNSIIKSQNYHFPAKSLISESKQIVLNKDKNNLMKMSAFNVHAGKGVVKKSTLSAAPTDMFFNSFATNFICDSPDNLNDTGWSNEKCLNSYSQASNDSDFARFEAKFNSSVEALWHDQESNDRQASQDETFNKTLPSESLKPVGANGSQAGWPFPLIHQFSSVWSQPNQELFDNENVTARSPSRCFNTTIKISEDTIFAGDKTEDTLNASEQTLNSSFVTSGYDKEQYEIASTVSLKNHSERSGFVEVKHSKQLPCANSTKKCYNNAQSAMQTSDGENLLTSEKTHFRPIKQSYEDGHEFQIESDLGPIELRRSSSGRFFIGVDSYFLYHEDKTSRSVTETESESFFLKVRVKKIDKQCQTEDEPEIGLNQSIHFRNSIQSTEEVQSLWENSCNRNHWFGEKTDTKFQNNNFQAFWNSCPNCNELNKSAPADRLLKEAVDIDADEIMSDLKYMQDLYIGSDDMNEADEMVISSSASACCNESSRANSAENTDQQEIIFYNITKLIADLLTSENAKSLANVLKSGLNCKDKLESNDVQSWGLWANSGDEIWQQNIGSYSEINHENQYITEHNWQYSSLAEIWNRTQQAECKSPKSKSGVQSIHNINNKSQSKTKSSTNSKSKISNRFRKRRHSASQNVTLFRSQADLENNNDIGQQNDLLCNLKNVVSFPETIITCKYLSFNAAGKFINLNELRSEENAIEYEYNGPSILKNAKTASRPLTR